MRPHRHFCGMVAAASPPLSCSTPEPTRRRRHFSGSPPMQRLAAQDSKGMDPFVQERH
jgi:hypothetical protein